MSEVMALPAVALVGQRDRPVDGVRDFCAQLTLAMAKLGAELELAEVQWDVEGWRPALRRLTAESRRWSGRSVLVQYTHGMWPWRGFPFAFLPLLRALLRSRVRVVVVLHDPSPFPGARVRDRARQYAQVFVMRQALRMAHRVVSTISPERIDWMREQGVARKVTFIPVGSNMPEDETERHASDPPPGQRKIVVFGVTYSPKIPEHITAREVEDIAFAVTTVASRVPGVRLDVFGRGSVETAARFRQAFEGTGVPVCVHGLLPPASVPSLLRHADALLYVRGHLSTRRTTGIAAIAAGLPIVGYEGPETDVPVREAGAMLVPFGDREGVAKALERVLVEPELHRELRRRNGLAHARHFSWDVIARRYLDLLFPNAALTTDPRPLG